MKIVVDFPHDGYLCIPHGTWTKILHHVAGWLDMPELDVMDVRMERAVDPGHSEEGAANRSSGLGYHPVAAMGPSAGGALLQPCRASVSANASCGVLVWSCLPRWRTGSGRGTSAPSLWRARACDAIRTPEEPCWSTSMRRPWNCLSVTLGCVRRAGSATKVQGLNQGACRCPQLRDVYCAAHAAHVHKWGGRSQCSIIPAKLDAMQITLPLREDAGNAESLHGETPASVQRLSSEGRL